MKIQKALLKKGYTGVNQKLSWKSRRYVRKAFCKRGISQICNFAHADNDQNEVRHHEEQWSFSGSHSTSQDKSAKLAQLAKILASPNLKSWWLFAWKSAQLCFLLRKKTWCCCRSAAAACCCCYVIPPFTCVHWKKMIPRLKWQLVVAAYRRPQTALACSCWLLPPPSPPMPPRHRQLELERFHFLMIDSPFSFLDLGFGFQYPFPSIGHGWFSQEFLNVYESSLSCRRSQRIEIGSDLYFSTTHAQWSTTSENILQFFKKEFMFVS